MKFRLYKSRTSAHDFNHKLERFPLAPVTAHTVHAVRYDRELRTPSNEELTVEAPLLIRVNGKPYLTTLRTPGDDQRLVRGLLFTDSVVNARRAPLECDFRHDAEAGLDTFDVSVPPAYLLQSVESSRAGTAASSCGLCGTVDPSRMEPIGEPIRRQPDDRVFVHELLAWVAEMDRAQGTFNRTGGSHAAAAFDARNELLLACEDIGRHNAVDKVIGGLLEDGRLDRIRSLTVSGRISYEITLKAYRAGAPILAAVSAPSSLAVDFARKFGLTLAGFCRQDRITVYSHPERIVSVDSGGSV